LAAVIGQPGRRIMQELQSLLGKQVEIILVDGKKYRGTLLGFEHPDYNLLLGDVKISEEETIPRLIVLGKVVAEIRAYELSLFNPREFAAYLIRQLGLRRDAVKVIEDAGVVMVYNSVRVTPDGVEGSGTLAAKVSYVFREYMERKKRGEKLL